MNGGLDSECSSGCESGWTMYLDHSNISSPQNPCKRNGGFVDGNGYKAKVMVEDYDDAYEEEEDLSMVSDASSGPPHFNEEDEDYYCDENGWFCFGSSAPPLPPPPPPPTTTTTTTTAALPKKSIKRQKIRDQQQQQKSEYHPSVLDDTASSPMFSMSKNNDQQATMENVLDFSQGFSATHFKGRSTFQKQLGLLKSSSSMPRANNFSRTS